MALDVDRQMRVLLDVCQVTVSMAWLQERRDEVSAKLYYISRSVPLEHLGDHFLRKIVISGQHSVYKSGHVEV